MDYMNNLMVLSLKQIYAEDKGKEAESLEVLEKWAGLKFAPPHPSNARVKKLFEDIKGKELTNAR